MKILQVSTEDIGGGAEKIALTLHEGYRSRFPDAWLAVGRKKIESPEILRIPNDEYRPLWPRFWYGVANSLYPFALRHRALAKTYGLLKAVGQPGTWLARKRGEENFDYPATWQLLDLPPTLPDIVHCHNLHGEYFDLRVLPELSRRVPLFLTLHDAWLLSGHCAYSFECDRWKTGCGQCPDLASDPAIERDATAFNWQRKRDIYCQSKLYIATPSQWLMERVQQSILLEGIVESRVIPNGIDLTIFQPIEKKVARAELNLPLEPQIILFAANGIHRNPRKDYATTRTAVEILTRQMPEQSLIFLAIGEEGLSENIGNSKMQFVPYQKNPQAIARYYQAADLYINAAKADNFPNTVLEALACGTPVVGTKVGGIPEQIEDGKNGFLVPVGDAPAMAIAIRKILENPDLQRSMSDLATLKARQNYSSQRMIDSYIDWYRSIIESRKDIDK